METPPRKDQHVVSVEVELEAFVELRLVVAHVIVGDARKPCRRSAAVMPYAFERRIWCGRIELAGLDQLVAGGDDDDHRAAR